MGRVHGGRAIGTAGVWGEGAVFAFFLLAAGAVIAVVGIRMTEEGCPGRKVVVVLGAGRGVGGGGGEGGHWR